MPVRPSTRVKSPFGSTGVSGGGVSQNTAPDPFGDPYGFGDAFGAISNPGYTGGHGVPGGNYFGVATPTGLSGADALAAMNNLKGFGHVGQGFAHLPFILGPDGQENYLPSPIVTPGGTPANPGAGHSISFAEAAAMQQAARDRMASLAATPGYAEAAHAAAAEAKAQHDANRPRRPGEQPPLVIGPNQNPPAPPLPQPAPLVQNDSFRVSGPGTPPAPAPLQPSQALTTTTSAGAAANAAGAAGARQQGGQSLMFPNGKRPAPTRSPFDTPTAQPKTRSPFQTSGVNLY